MDHQLLVAEIYDNSVEFNPACFDFTEEQARAMKLWTDARPMPTKAELESAKENAEARKELRKKAKSDRKKLFKNKNAKTEDRIQAIIEHLGLDVD